MRAKRKGFAYDASIPQDVVKPIPKQIVKVAKEVQQLLVDSSNLTPNNKLWYELSIMQTYRMQLI